MATTFVDVTYRGLKLQEKAKLVDEGALAFLESEVPLPVGSVLAVLAEGQSRAARVVGVVEHEAGAQGQPAGMRLAWGGEAVSLPAAPARPAPSEDAPTVRIVPAVVEETPTVPITPAVVAEPAAPVLPAGAAAEPAIEASADASADSSVDESSPGGGDPDASSDGSPPSPNPGNGTYAPGKKPRKSKRRR